MAITTLDMAMIEGTLNGANGAVQLDGSGNLPAVNGSALTGIASNVTLVTSGAFSAAATVNLTSVLDDTSDHWVLLVTRFTPSTLMDVGFRFSSNGGSTWITSGYAYSGTTLQEGYYYPSSQGGTGTSAKITSDGSSTRMGGGVRTGQIYVDIWSPGNTGNYPSITWRAQTYNDSGAYPSYTHGASVNEANAAIDSIQIWGSTGTLTGRYALLKMETSA